MINDTQKQNNFPLSFALSSFHYSTLFHFLKKLFAFNKDNELNIQFNELNLCVGTFHLQCSRRYNDFASFGISMKLGYSLAITTDFSTAFHMFYIHFSTPHYAYFSTPHPDPKPILAHCA